LEHEPLITELVVVSEKDRMCAIHNNTHS